MPTVVRFKRSGTAAAVPASLEHGEVAINYADGRLYWKNASNQIRGFRIEEPVLAISGGTTTPLVLEFQQATA